ncbi:MAG: hypothetical protein DRN30_00725 [Thermoplasmata archaeon]|nr:MAG: hypothetical protein DRN30_00725 [Thermoplasmata archaeon]
MSEKIATHDTIGGTKNVEVTGTDVGTNKRALDTSDLAAQTKLDEVIAVHGASGSATLNHLEQSNQLTHIMLSLIKIEQHLSIITEEEL